MDSDVEFVPCDLCSNDETRPYDNIAGRRDIVQCTECGLVYTNPRPRRESYLRVSGTDPMVWRPPEVLEERDRGRFRMFISELSGMRVMGRLLDVGCGHGFSLEVAEQMGFECYGVEIQGFSADYAKDQLGLKVFCGELMDAKYPDDFFDVVTMYRALEHLLNPSETLKEIRRVLNPDGIFCVSVPNVKSYNAQNLPDWWGIYHMYHFSPETLQKLLLGTGFEIEKLIINPHMPLGKQKLTRRKLFFDRFGWGIRIIRSILSHLSKTRVSQRMHQGGITIYASPRTAMPSV